MMKKPTFQALLLPHHASLMQSVPIVRETDKLSSPFQFLLRSGVILLLALLMASTSFAQNITVSGKVLNQTGEPLPGATVNATVTAIATTTDANGSFHITMPQKTKRLTVSYVGMDTKEVDIAG